MEEEIRREKYKKKRRTDGVVFFFHKYQYPISCGD